MIQAAGAAAFGAAAGVLLVTLAFPVVVTFVVVVIVGFVAGIGLTLIDQRYHLTDRARARMMGYEESLKKNWWELENAVAELDNLISNARQIIYTVDKYWRIADELTRWNIPNQYKFR